MATFPLKVLTAEKVFFEGEVDRCVVRTATGDLGILPRHINYVAPLGIGALTVVQNGQSRAAAIAGGFVEITAQGTTIIARTCEWADEIDLNRARTAEERARARLQGEQSRVEMDRAQVKLKRAINRIRIAEK